jgi:AcrR family transcriptional regulator
MPRERGQRREQILQVLAGMLQDNPGGRITTAALAAQVGVSEAALYRHFPSKARMFEGLIAFIEETLFTRITAIVAEPEPAVTQCGKIVMLVLGFAEKNPGISRVLNGDALSGEHERLRVRVSQIFDRLETQPGAARSRSEGRIAYDSNSDEHGRRAARVHGRKDQPVRAHRFQATANEQPAGTVAVDRRRTIP